MTCGCEEVEVDLHSVKVLLALAEETAEETTTAAAEQTTKETSLVNGRRVDIGAVGRQGRDEVLEQVGDLLEGTSDGVRVVDV